MLEVIFSLKEGKEKAPKDGRHCFALLSTGPPWLLLLQIICRFLCLLTLANLAHKANVSLLALYLRLQLGLHISVRNHGGNRAAARIRQSFLFVYVQLN